MNVFLCRTMFSLQLQKDTRKDMHEEKKEAQREHDEKRAKKEQLILGRGRGKGRGRGRGKKVAEGVEEREPGKCTDEAASSVAEASLQKLRQSWLEEAGRGKFRNDGVRGCYT